MNATNPSLDMDTLNMLKDIMEDKFDMLIDAYLGEAPLLLEQIELAISEADSTQLRFAAHSLKSSSANLGGNLLADMARELESLGIDGRVAEAGEVFSQAQAEFLRIRATLRP